MKIGAETDVLIVGGGPTGLMLANQLARRGVDFVIIERNSGPARETRALGVQARTMEIYSHLSIIDQALELGLRATGAHLWVKGRHGARIPFGDIGTDLSPYPFLLILGQEINERLLGDALRKQGGGVLWNTELMQLQQRPDHAVATIRQADGSTGEIRARWIAGCDGARSAVRNLNGIDFVGAPYEQVFFVADTTASGPMAPFELNVYLWRDGFHLFFPMRGEGNWRVVGILPPDLRHRDDVRFEDVVPSIVEHAGVALAFQECRWFSTYRIHHRRAARFRDRRCFVLGDAAHIHSPVGAQGMNTGLQDAYNLAWKLALVVKGLAAETLLDTYETERLPFADSLLKTTDTGFALVVSDRWISRILRTRVIAKVAATAMRFERARKFAFRGISQIGIRYPQSVLSENLSGLPDKAPQAGERFPWLKLKFTSDGPVQDLFQLLDDTCFNLILIGQETNPVSISEMNSSIRLHHVPIDSQNKKELDRAGIPIPSFYFLRPDCYIGLAGRVFETGRLKQYLSERLQLRIPPAGGK